MNNAVLDALRALDAEVKFRKQLVNEAKQRVMVSDAQTVDMVHNKVIELAEDTVRGSPAVSPLRRNPRPRAPCFLEDALPRLALPPPLHEIPVPVALPRRPLVSSSSPEGLLMSPRRPPGI
eukprot:TRINITY_DN7265_c1_g1_i1.p1 TRINITY_DN7265_c1_g1~~TRINITY_DN7265_c1_g1_i1.p1  ORF type:complete len:121 (+),score=19.99 TRINITY_DN7265_c1_g1_i1:254-616(+)